MKGLLFTFLLTYGGAAASLVNPFVGLLIYVCFAIVRPESMWHWSVPEGNYSRIIAIGLLAGWVLQGCGRWQFGRGTVVVSGLLGLLLWAILSSLQAANPAVGWKFVEALLKTVLPCLVAITTIDSVKRLKALAWVILLSQGYLAFDLNLSYYGGFNKIQEMGFGGMDNNCVAIGMVACTGLALFLGLHEERWWAKGLCLILALLMVHAVLFAFSRGGMVALILTAAVAFFLIPKQPMHYLIFSIILLVGLRLAGPEVQKRFSTSFADDRQRDESAQSRLDLWADMWDCTLKHPVFGVGPGHWAVVSHEYGWSVGKEGHSLWLQVLAELGFPGIFFFAVFYGGCVLRLYGLCRHPEAVADPWLIYLARMVVVSVFGFVVAAQFVSLIGLEVPYYIAIIGAGVLKLSSVRQAAPAARRIAVMPALALSVR